MPVNLSAPQARPLLRRFKLLQLADTLVTPSSRRTYNVALRCRFLWLFSAKTQRRGDSRPARCFEPHLMATKIGDAALVVKASRPAQTRDVATASFDNAP